MHSSRTYTRTRSRFFGIFFLSFFVSFIRSIFLSLCVYNSSSNKNKCAGAKWQCRDTVIHKIIVSCELKSIGFKYQVYNNQQNHEALQC